MVFLKKIKLLPEVLPIVEFYINHEYEKVYFEINGKHYICKKRINNWITENLDINTPGIYDIVISSENKVLLKTTLEFTKGIQENDMDI